VLIDRDFHAITIETDEGFVTDGLYNIGTSEDFGWELTPGNYESRRTQALEDIRTKGEAQGHYTLLLHDPFTRYGYRDGILIDWTAEILDSVKTMYGDRLKFVNISEAADILSGTGTSAHENDTDVPIAAKLHANYPNPFNPITQIPYTVTESSHVEINVYDVHGRRVAQLINGIVTPGEHRVGFDASGLASGVYVYQLKTQSQIFTRSMVLVK
ncbi:MAG: T9SS type A sorting domain-containing protein, partial [Balneolales bacterium]|nr:T9SS type A sorting domain-containing protein [Balneolales bacterium]